MYDDTLLDGGIFLIAIGSVLFLLAPVFAKWPAAFLYLLEDDAATAVTRVVGGIILVLGVVNIFRALL